MASTSTTLTPTIAHLESDSDSEYNPKPQLELCTARRITRACQLSAIGILVVGLLVTIRAATDGAKMDMLTAETIPGSVLVYLGNGCFWERQWAYVEIETTDWHRAPRNVSAKVGYAGGTRTGASGNVCYHCGLACPDDYSTLGHAEVVQVRLDSPLAAQQMRALARDYFDSMSCSEQGCARPDPGDRGHEYRSMVGIPGGMDGALYPVLAAANTHGMTLKRGKGDDSEAWNTVLVYDSHEFPFHLGEPYHQFRALRPHLEPQPSARAPNSRQAGQGRARPTREPPPPTRRFELLQLRRHALSGVVHERPVEPPKRDGRDSTHRLPIRPALVNVG